MFATYLIKRDYFVTCRWFSAQRYYVHKTCFREICKDTKVICPFMWTYDIDTSTYYDYY